MAGTLTIGAELEMFAWKMSPLVADVAVKSNTRAIVFAMTNSVATTTDEIAVCRLSIRFLLDDDGSRWLFGLGRSGWQLEQEPLVARIATEQETRIEAEE